MIKMPQGYQTVMHYFYQLVLSPTTAVCVEGDLEVVAASLRVGGKLSLSSRDHTVIFTGCKE